MPHHTHYRRDILLGGALLAAVAVSTGGVVAEAAPAATAECTTARQDVKDRQQELTDAVAAYRKQTSVVATLQAKYQRLQADDRATAADIEAARLAAYNAQTKATSLFAAQQAAGVALQHAVRVAEDVCQKSEERPSQPPTPPGGDDPRPPQHPDPGHPHPGHPRGPVHRPAPVIQVESSSSSQATAVAVGGPGVVAVPVADSRDEGWFGGWVGDWFGGSGDGGSGGGPGDGSGGAGAAVAAPEEVGSSLPLGAVETGDGSAPGLDLGHIGMAVAGLGALGLAGAGGAALAGRRRS